MSSTCESRLIVFKATKKSKLHILKAAENAGQAEDEVAKDWFDAVRKIEEETGDIEEKYDQRKCAAGWCVNCWSLYKLSKKSVDLKKKVLDRLENIKFDVARPPSPKSVIDMQTEAIIENQPSTQCTLREMLDCILDPHIGIIGVYGMGGVGKTTLVKQLNNHFKKNSCFEIVIMIRVSATPNIPSIQTSIGKRLGLPDNSDSDALYEALSKKKFLLILDDVWCELKLENVGIPQLPNDKESKILVISRNQDTCTDMGASKKIKVKPLTDEESWMFFVKKAGEHVAVDDLKRLAEQIVERCDGLPLAIVTVARAMVNRHGVREWANAVREMKVSATDLRGMIKEVLVPLKFSFDILENNMLKSLFLYCACFPEDHIISEYEILNYCFGEGLEDRLGSLTDARNKGEALLGSLKIACMLEDGEEKNWVRMHDMMRELALWIASLEYSDGSNLSKFVIRTGGSVKKAPQAHEWVDATWVSLIDTQIKELPKLEEMCQKLSTFQFRNNRICTVIPEPNFLQHMVNLKSI
ncbi:disease resistance protein RPS5-like [Telopea speciosissima]|uniref:disease resistance protein RPS5-like n=1 Tax=Telopea speciosissima TaxID=54955 RepID=UPI001CC4AE22|nr:disease resistance protein RPS5-like [Telopea speciosissima]